MARNRKCHRVEFVVDRPPGGPYAVAYDRRGRAINAINYPKGHRQRGARLDSMPKEAPVSAKIPDWGSCIGTAHHGYKACFAARGSALRAARRLAERKRTRVDVVRVSNRGEDRNIIREIEPRSWRKR